MTVTGETSRALLELNRRFYRRMALQFSATRQTPWPGWNRVLRAIVENGGQTAILDLGCGNARFAAACAARLEGQWSYLGVDASPELVAAARKTLAAAGVVDGRVREVDLLATEAGWPSGSFDLVALFGVMHHVPGAEARRGVLRRAFARVAPGGRLAVSYWQLGDSARLMARRVEPSALGLAAGALVADDHLLRWGDGDAVRYCHHCRPAEAAAYAAELAAASVETYRADGEDGEMNLYQLITRQRNTEQTAAAGC